jgi:hypothetical protein
VYGHCLDLLSAEKQSIAQEESGGFATAADRYSAAPRRFGCPPQDLHRRRWSKLGHVSQIFGIEQLEAAADVIAQGAGSPRHRLASAWANQLARIDPSKDLPAEVRQRFRALPMFGRKVTVAPHALLATLNDAEVQSASAEIVAICERAGGRLGR